MSKNTPKDETKTAFTQEGAVSDERQASREAEVAKRHQYRPARLIGLYGRMP